MKRTLALVLALAMVLSLLTACGKKLRTSDTAFLKDAERLLNEEFAYVLEIAPAEVPAYIRAHIAE